MRILGLDLGSKTIGIALSDPMGWTAQGITTIERRAIDEDLNALERLVRDHEVEKIVVGLPLQMNGEEGTQAATIRKFTDRLSRKLPETPILHWDERLSTVAAERGLLEADLSRAKRKKVINKMAAVFILQGYLDAQAGQTLS